MDSNSEVGQKIRHICISLVKLVKKLAIFKIPPEVGQKVRHMANLHEKSAFPG